MLYDSNYMEGKTRLIVKTPVISGGSGEHGRAGGKSRGYFRALKLFSMIF